MEYRIQFNYFHISRFYELECIANPNHETFDVEILVEFIMLGFLLINLMMGINDYYC